MKIEGRKVDKKENYLDRATYVPGHASGNVGHPDCELGVIIGVTKDSVRVLYCNSRTVQRTTLAIWCGVEV